VRDEVTPWHDLEFIRCGQACQPATSSDATTLHRLIPDPEKIVAGAAQFRDSAAEVIEKLTTLYEAFIELDFSILLPAVVTIADEVDAQLKQQMLRFMAGDAAKAVKADKAA
jgi:hypothetical protein